MNAPRLARAALRLLVLAGTPVLAGAGGPAGSEPAPPLMAWTLDEGTGSITLDPMSLTWGTLEGSPPATWFAPGPFAHPGDHYLGFDGSDDRVLVRSGGVLAGRASSSVSVWFRCPTSPPPRQLALYSERDSCEFNVFWVGIEKRPGLTPGICFAIYDSSSPVCASGSWHTLTFPFIPADIAWHHVVATLDPVGGMKLYYDGALVASLPGVPPYGGGAQGSSTIGHAHVPGHPTYWAGSIDEVGLFDHALSPAEVHWLYTNSLNGLPAPTYDRLCLGDGTGTDCPCGNTDHLGSGGCPNSSSSGGASLSAYGGARTSLDTLFLSATQMPIGVPCLFFQGTSAVNGGAGVVLGDGLRCAGGSVARLGVHLATDHYDWYPHVGDASISVQGAIAAPGTERFYQVWYRDPGAHCTPAVFNTTNAVRVLWLP